MSAQPLVSVLLPLHNGAPWIADTIASVQAQTYPHWELMVVDDQCSDRSPEIVAELAVSDPRIHLLTNQGHGILPALQTGFQNSNGTFHTRLDQDDLMTPIRLQAMVTAAASEGPQSLVLGQLEYFSDDGELGEGYRSYAKWLNETTAAKRNFDDIYRECTVPSPGWLTHRQNLVACKAFQHDVYPEDYELAFRFRKQKLKLVPVPETILHWRDHSLRASRQQEEYADNRFTELKVKHFLDQDYDPKRELFLWGAGKRGKQVAQRLVHHRVRFRWMCNNPNKIGHEIYGVVLEDSSVSKYDADCKIIVAVGAPDEKSRIESLLADQGLCLGSNYFFFC